MLRTVASLHDRPPDDEQATCAAEADREARFLGLVAHANVLKVLQPPLGSATLTLEWCDIDVAQARRVKGIRTARRSSHSARRSSAVGRSPLRW